MFGSRLLTLLMSAAIVQSPPLDRNIEVRVEVLRKQILDSSAPMPTRQDAAMELAETLDRAGQAAKSEENCRSLWKRAWTELESFNQANPRHTRAAMFGLQAAVYRWVEASSWARQAELSPADKTARARALTGFEAAIEPLGTLVRSLSDKKDLSLVEQNARYRLGKAVCDLAHVEAESSDAEHVRKADSTRRRALAVLNPTFAERSLAGRAKLLEARVLADLGQFVEASKSLEEAVLTPKLPEDEVLPIRTSILIGKGQYDQALALIKSSKAGRTLKERLSIEVKLSLAIRLAPGPERLAAESEVFADLAKLRENGGEDATLALITLSRKLSEPTAGQPASAFDALADAKRASGDFKSAAKLELKASEIAKSKGHESQSRDFAFKSGALLYQAGEFLDAAEALSKLRDEPSAGELRPKAGMLRALALGKVLHDKDRDKTRQAYLDSLTAQIRDFPNDKTVAEARWLLGEQFALAGKQDEAVSTWANIPKTHPRWIDAQIAMAQVRQDELDLERLGGDKPTIAAKYTSAKAILDKALEEAGNDRSAATELELARARLDLTPGVDQAENARLICKRLKLQATRETQRLRALGLEIAAQCA